MSILQRPGLSRLDVGVKQRKGLGVFWMTGFLFEVLLMFYLKSVMLSGYAADEEHLGFSEMQLQDQWRGKVFCSFVFLRGGVKNLLNTSSSRKVAAELWVGLVDKFAHVVFFFWKAKYNLASKLRYST